MQEFDLKKVLVIKLDKDEKDFELVKDTECIEKVVNKFFEGQ